MTVRSSSGVIDLRELPSQAEESLHHWSHRPLLAEVRPAVRDSTPARGVDAIVVPAFRRVGSLTHVLAVARDLDCLLLVLCSGKVRAVEVMRRANGDPRVMALDVAGLAGLLPPTRTGALTAATRFDRGSDISLKRNLALMIAWAEGWRRIAFLDDDIEVPDVADLPAAAALTERFDAVGLANDGFPDNSVVCHALRASGVEQDSFIGGGAMVINTDRTSFFPDIYNEDWFFLLDGTRLGSVGVFGTVAQKSFDPFAKPQRAAQEEFGDCLAEGVFWLLDNGGEVGDADRSYWTAFLARREALTADIGVRLAGKPMPRRRRARILAALAAARRFRALVEPEFCVRYLQAWRQDRETWAAQRAGLLPAAGRLAVMASVRTSRGMWY